MEKILKAEGMMCIHCEAHVKEAMKKIPGVKEAFADHEKGEVKVILEAEIDESILKQAINDAGYKAL